MAKLRELSAKREIVKSLYKLAWREADTDRYLNTLTRIMKIEKEIDDLEREIKELQKRGALA